MSRKQDIIDAATELFSRNGFHATSTHQVAKLAEVSEGIIFYYFKTKEDILLDIFYTHFDRFLEAMQEVKSMAPSGMEALHAWAELHFEAINSRAKEFLLLVRDFPAHLVDQDSPHREPVLGRVATLDRYLVEMVTRGQEDGSVRSGDPVMLAIALRSLLIGATKMAFMENAPIEGFSQNLWDFCYRALTPNPSQA